MVVSGQLHVPAALLSAVKELMVPLNRRLGVFQSLQDAVGKREIPFRNRTQVVQLVA
jgi:hypothetical protein